MTLQILLNKFRNVFKSQDRRSNREGNVVTEEFVGLVKLDLDRGPRENNEPTHYEDSGNLYRDILVTCAPKIAIVSYLDYRHLSNGSWPLNGVKPRYFDVRGFSTDIYAHYDPRLPYYANTSLRTALIDTTNHRLMRDIHQQLADTYLKTSELDQALEVVKRDRGHKTLTEIPSSSRFWSYTPFLS